jgi:hypothetical protein
VASLVVVQAEFLLHVGEVVKFATVQGWFVTGGELYRTVEQQALHFQAGRSKTMNSQHLKRLAIDLNFIKSGVVCYSQPELEPIGKFWESLHPKNVWGGHWKSFRDTPHFERQE